MSLAHRSRVSVEIPGNQWLYGICTLPSDWEKIGTVTTSQAAGLLVRNTRTGIYCQYCCGAIRSLPQDKVLAALRAVAAPDASND